MNCLESTQHYMRSVLVKGVSFLSALNNEDFVWKDGKPPGAIDCFGISSDEQISRYLELGDEEKGLGREHI